MGSNDYYRFAVRNAIVRTKWDWAFDNWGAQNSLGELKAPNVSALPTHSRSSYLPSVEGLFRGGPAKGEDIGSTALKNNQKSRETLIFRDFFAYIHFFQYLLTPPGHKTIPPKLQEKNVAYDNKNNIFLHIYIFFRTFALIWFLCNPWDYFMSYFSALPSPPAP